MGILLPVLLFVSSVYTVTGDGHALRRTCDPRGAEVTKLKQGAPVTIRFAMNGEYGACYKVAVESDGKTLEGWLPANALTGLDAFDRERQSAQSVDTPQAVRKDIAEVRQQVAGKIQFAAVDPRVAEASRLLAANQPEEALKRMESALRANGRDPGLLALAGVAAFQSDQVKQAVDYFQASLTLSPNPAVERMLQRARREAQEDQSGAKLFGVRFVLRYDPREVSADEARLLLPVLESEFGRVSEALGCRTDERIVAVLQGREAYLRTTGAAEWSGGHYDGRIRVALLDSPPGAHTRQTLAHEIVHACLARTGNWPVWLHEGLAQKLSGEALPSGHRTAAAQMVKSGELPPLANLSASWSRMSARHAAAAYALAYLAADHLYTAYGSDGVRSLLQSPERLSQVSLDLDRRLRQ